MLMVSCAIAVRPVISVTPERLVVREGEAAQFTKVHYTPPL